MPADRPASLHLFPDRIVWGSRSFHGGQTRRPACVLLIGAHAPLRLTPDSGRPLTSRAVLVAPGVTRGIDADNAGFYSVSIDPCHPAYPHLCREVLGDRAVLDLGDQFTAAQATAIARQIDRPPDCGTCRGLSDRLLAAFAPGIATAKPIDARVRATAAFLRREPPSRVDMRALSALCHLSAGRLTHLFTEQIGVSIRTYLRWVKLCRAAELFGQPHSVAEVAAAIGFADSSHLIRVFRGYFAVKPSLLADTRRVQVTVCRCPGPTPG